VSVITKTLDCVPHKQESENMSPIARDLGRSNCDVTSSRRQTSSLSGADSSFTRTSLKVTDD